MTNEENLTFPAFLKKYYAQEQSYVQWLEEIKERELIRYRELGLSDEELAAIYGYTTGGYKKLNQALLSGNPRSIKQVSTFVKTLNSALDKLPDHTKLVHRGVKSDEKLLAQMVVGSEFEYKGYLSSSKPMSYWQYEDEPIQFVIQSKHGKFIGERSQSDHPPKNQPS